MRETPARYRLTHRAVPPHGAGVCFASEAEWQATVIAALVAGGWRWMHHHDSRKVARAPVGTPVALQRTGRGFPDLIAVRGSRLLAIELKSARGRLSHEQGAWLADLAGAGLETYVWRPQDRATMEWQLKREGEH